MTTQHQVALQASTGESTESTGPLLSTAETVAETIKLTEMVAAPSVKGCQGTWGLHELGTEMLALLH